MQRFHASLMLVLVASFMCRPAYSERQVAPKGSPSSADPSPRYFPGGLLHATWREFPVRGYSRPVTGVVYRGRPRPTCGMPLGGLDTGCLDIEPNGMLGFCTLFNQLVNPRLLYNVPFLGLSVTTWPW